MPRTPGIPGEVLANLIENLIDGLWKKQFLERGTELFAQDDSVQEHERRLADLEQLLGRKEVEIALLKDLLGRNG